ncbi:MAG: aminodeoxychorismate/anthranilate synthase component II [Desulfobacula sp.]|jgi:anthranilate synthase component II|nr:aminodeoxychorismate/anthranilate synthase component II [Desulfobacula sp.]MBT6339839.1 aminodeoxychorismate/anthranilate synthase component II [Desulfobacula sp.]MBT7259873.1 aminodeoxychorismate/anthranilate synthase component II [Desulfobacula sp.]
MIAMIDNYDSFTYNLVQYLKMLGADVLVFRNNQCTIDDITLKNPAGIVISPGPGRPEGAGQTLSVIKNFSGKKPVLGICLGHQSIAAAFGGKIIGAKKIMHGKTSMVTADGKHIYNGIKKPFQAMRYHSLAVCKKTLPDCFKITSQTDDGEIMGLRHKTHPTQGMQFHPESIMTPIGKRLLRNFLKSTGDI